MQNTSAIIRIIIWSLVALLLIGILITGLGSGGIFTKFGWNFGSSFYYKDSDLYSVGSAEVNADTIRAIEVHWVSGSVNIEPQEGENISFTEDSNKNLSKKEQLHYYVDGDRLIIQFCAAKRGWNIFQSNTDKDLTVGIPPSLSESLETLVVENVASSVSVKNISIQNIDIETDAGAITLKQVFSKKIEIESVSGGVDFTGSAANIKCSSLSGSVRMDSSVCPDYAKFETLSGNIELLIPDNEGFTATYDKLSGNIYCDFPATKSDGSIKYKDGGADFDFETLSGNINIRQKSEE